MPGKTIGIVVDWRNFNIATYNPLFILQQPTISTFVVPLKERFSATMGCPYSIVAFAMRAGKSVFLSALVDSSERFPAYDSD